jgi:hypothetical protein
MVLVVTLAGMLSKVPKVYAAMTVSRRKARIGGMMVLNSR